MTSTCFKFKEVLPAIPRVATGQTCKARQRQFFYFYGAFTVVTAKYSDSCDLCETLTTLNNKSDNLTAD